MMDEQQQEQLVRFRAADLLDARLERSISVLVGKALYDWALRYAKEERIGVGPYCRKVIAQHIAERQVADAEAEEVI
jgi:hypothetical protein